MQMSKFGIEYQNVLYAKLQRMKVEIDRRLNRIRDIKYEPQLLSNNTEELLQSSNQTG